MKKLALWMIIAALWAGQRASAFIVFNGDFESGSLAPWYQDNNFSDPAAGVDWHITSSDAHSGLYSATCTGNIELRQDLTPILTSDISDISFWLKQPNGPSVSALYFFYTDSTSSSTVVQLASTDWESFDVTGDLDMDPGKTLAAISVYGYNSGDSTGAGDQTFLDDFQIVATPEPASCWLLCLGLAGFLLRRRVNGLTRVR